MAPFYNEKAGSLVNVYHILTILKWGSSLNLNTIDSFGCKCFVGRVGGSCPVICKMFGSVPWPLLVQLYNKIGLWTLTKFP